MNDVQIGDTFGAWTVIAAAPAHPFRGTARWKVQCGGCAATCVREENQLKAKADAGLRFVNSVSLPPFGTRAEIKARFGRLVTHANE